MSLLKTIPPEEAAGGMKRVYNSFADAMGMVPPPLVTSSTSPVLQALLASCLVYYNEHRTLSQKLIAFIRFSTAVIFNLESCLKFSENALRLHGMDDEQIERLKFEPGSADLKTKDKLLYEFTIKALEDPDSVSAEDIRKLQKLHWTDADIFDALHVSAVMIGPGMIMRALKVE
jgi:alkylhydroperoxidase family enzyme